MFLHSALHFYFSLQCFTFLFFTIVLYISSTVFYIFSTGLYIFTFLYCALNFPTVLYIVKTFLHCTLHFIFLRCVLHFPNCALNFYFSPLKSTFHHFPPLSFTQCYTFLFSPLALCFTISPLCFTF